MTGRAVALALVALLVATVVLAVAVEAARGSFFSNEKKLDEPPALAAIRAEFGTGRLGGCFTGIAYRESRYDHRAVNLRDRHADGSRGSFGIFQIGALWRRPGETVGGFARRMMSPRENARLAHALYRRYGLQPWGGRC